MKTISKLIFSAVAALATMGFNAACYAVEVELPCCTGASCPTRYPSDGIPGVTQTATFKGVSVFVDGERKFLTTVAGDPGYSEWRTAVRQQFDKAAAVTLIKAASGIVVYARCSSTMATLNKLEKIKTLSCPEGDGIILEQGGSASTCEDPQTGPRSVVEITKETQRERQIREIKERIAARDAQIARNKEEMARNTQRIYESGQLVIPQLTQAIFSTIDSGASSSFL